MLILAALGLGLPSTPTHAQISIEVTYGVDRNVSSSESELDGLLNIAVDWLLPSGLGFGIRGDLQYEEATLSFSQLEGGSLYFSPSYELSLGAVAPFVRGGIGLGRAPCRGDTCTDGVYLGGSTGIRLRLVDKLRIVGEIGVTRVSRPFAGAGVSLRL